MLTSNACKPTKPQVSTLLDQLGLAETTLLLLRTDQIKIRNDKGAKAESSPSRENSAF